MRPDLQTLFTPSDRQGNHKHRFWELTFYTYCDGVDVACVPASFIDGKSRGIAGWIARTTAKRKSTQVDEFVWDGYRRVRVGVETDPTVYKASEVHHVGTGGPLFATRAEAGEAARLWRFGLSDEERAAQASLPHVA